MPRGICLFLAFCLSYAATGAAQTLSAIGGWPSTWIEAYGRFEKFMVEKQECFPPSDLRFTLDGEVVTSIKGIRPGKNPAMEVYHYGNNAGLWMTGYNWVNPFELRAYPPGQKFAAILAQSSSEACQHYHPIVWFETFDKTVAEVEKEMGRLPLRLPIDEVEPNPSPTPYRIIRMVSAPKNPDEVWPNERMLYFIDLTRLGSERFHRPTISEANTRVTPAILLSLNNKGVLQRESLGPALERLLVWRIYHNGVLVNKASAANDLKHAVGREPGNYTAMIGVVGPGGFMPVSNIMTFPLFPQGAGVAVMPAANKVKGFPDFLTAILPPDFLNAAKADPPREDRRYNAYFGFEKIPPLKAKDEFLLQLWSDWVWTLGMWDPTNPQQSQAYFPNFSLE